jgi:hypothetical protein
VKWKENVERQRGDTFQLVNPTTVGPFLAMGKAKGLYKEEFPQGSTVKIANRSFLENFSKRGSFTISWNLSN